MLRRFAPRNDLVAWTGRKCLLYGRNGAISPFADYSLIYFIIPETIAEQRTRVLVYIGVALWISVGIVIFVWNGDDLFIVDFTVTT